MPQPSSEPGREPRARTVWPNLVLCLAVVALAIAWQAWAVPPLAALVAPALGPASSPAPSLIVQALSVLGGGALLYSLLFAGRLLPARTAPQHTASPRWVCEQQLLELAQTLPIGTLVVLDGKIVTSSATARQQLGHDAKRLREMPPAALFSDAGLATAALTGALPFIAILELCRYNGEPFRVQLRVHAVTLDRHDFRVLLFDDLSEGERLDERMRQHQADLQALTGRLISLQESERRSLSRELHDDIGQAITAIKLSASSIADEDEAGRAEIVGDIIAIADETIIKLRNLAMLLRPPQLDALGLEAALRWQGETLFRTHQPTLKLEIAPLPQRPDAAVELACFRIAQEALTNVLRHSEASHVTLSLAEQGQTLLLSICDDGRGFEADSFHGLGLVTMRERAQQLGGSFEIDTVPGSGTCLRARLPMTPSNGKPSNGAATTRQAT